jgi:hypothetical protein
MKQHGNCLSEKTIYLLCQIRREMSSFSEDDIKHAAEAREWLMKQISDKQEQVDRLNTILDLIDSLLKQSSFKPASSITNTSRSSSSSSAGFTSQMSQKPTVSPQMMSHTSGNQSVGVTDSNPSSSSSSSSTVRETTASPETQEHKLSDSSKDGDEYRQVKPLKRLKDDFLMANAEISRDSLELIPAKGIALSVNTPPFRSFFLNRILEGMKTKDAEKISQNQIDESASINYNVDEDENGIIKRIIINNYRDKERLNEIVNTSTWVFTRMIEKSNNRA